MPPRDKPRTQLTADDSPLLPDVIGPELDLLFVGINPSLMSSRTGHHYARPGNRFWPALHQSGITAERLEPSRQRELLQIGCGLTNLVARPTAKASDLDASELREGFRQLAAKVARFQVRHVAFLGVTAFRTATGEAGVKIGQRLEPVGLLKNSPTCESNNVFHTFADGRLAPGEIFQCAATGEAIVYVLPNPSGLNAHYQLQDFERLFRELAEIVWG